MSIAEKLTTVAENIPKVYDAGKKAQYDEFWDSIQNYGKRTNYTYGFGGETWNSQTFKPKYNIDATNASYIFRTSTIEGDLREIFRNAGVTFSTAKSTRFEQAFAYCWRMTAIGVIDTRNCAVLTQMFYGSRIETIEKLILKDDGTQTFSKMFEGNDRLKNIKITGVIGNDIGFQYTNVLTKESIISIIKALSNSTSGKTLSLSTNAVNAIDWSNTVIDGITYNTFDDIANIKTNWHITLIESEVS